MDDFVRVGRSERTNIGEMLVRYKLMGQSVFFLQLLLLNRNTEHVLEALAAYF